MSAAPTAQDLTALAVRLASVTDRVESRLGQVSEQTLSASQAMVRQTHDAQKVAAEVTQVALEQFRQAAASAIRDGMRGATEQYDQTLAASAHKVVDAASLLEARMARSGALHWATAWKAFLALLLAGTTVVAVAGYIVWQARQNLAGLRWQQEIADAQAAGKLAPCPEGGLCAMVNKRWTRIDK